MGRADVFGPPHWTRKDLLVDPEFPQRVAKGCPSRGAIHADIAPAARHAQGFDATRASGGGVDGRPGCAIVGGLNLIGACVSRLPCQLDVTETLRGAEIDLNPLRISPRTRPTGTRVAVIDEGRLTA